MGGGSFPQKCSDVLTLFGVARFCFSDEILFDCGGFIVLPEIASKEFKLSKLFTVVKMARVLVCQVKLP